MLEIAPHLRKYLETGSGPVVALESTLLAHGLPESRRRAVARALEDAVREEGAHPATIAIIDGKLRVGLLKDDLDRLLFGSARKASLRDVSIAMAQGGVWATTVASTMRIACLAKIRVFATGGIGGVHRSVETSWDESADLMALARYPVMVVSAGAKAVLDLPKTVERLETLGVPVLGFRTGEFPAFYHAHSGIRLDHKIETADEVASIMVHRFDELKEGGLLVVQTPPSDTAQDREKTESLILSALDKARLEGVRGSEITPYLLSALDEASSGSVVETNIALVIQNARLAAKIAVADQARRDQAHSD